MHLEWRDRRARLLSRLALVLLAVAWVLCASRPGTQVDGCPQGCAEPARRETGELRVMSLNVLHGFPHFEYLQQRLDRIGAEIRRQEADIVCLQEVPWTASRGSAADYLARATGLNYVYLRANGNRWAILFEEGEAILSRYPLQDIYFAELSPRAGFFEHRVLLGATAATPQGPVRVLVTHLTNGEPRINQAQASSLADLVATEGEGPLIVAGDFNAVEDAPQVRSLGWIDTYRAVHPGDAGYTCCIDDLRAGPGEPLEKRIDYIFFLPGASHATVTGSQRVLTHPAWTDGGWLWSSDHVGLLSSIALER